MKSFAIGSPVSEALWAEGTPSHIVLKGGLYLPFYSRYTGLADARTSLPERGFIFLFDQARIGSLPLGVTGWIAFDEAGLVIAVKATAGSFSLRKEPA